MAASDVFGLDPVIKRVDRVQHSRRGEYYYSLKETSGEINPPIWRIGGGKTFTYRVFTEAAGEPHASSQSSTIHIKDPDSEDLINLTIFYRTVCPEGKQQQVVESLGRSGDPDGVLRALVTGTARTFLWGAEGVFFSDSDDARKRLIAHVCNAVESQTGLRFQAWAHLEFEDKLVPIHIDEFFEIHFSNSQELRRVRLQADLDVLPKYALRAIVAMRRLDRLRLRIVEATKLYARQEIPAQAFAQQFRVGPYVDRLSALVGEIAARDGRSVSGLTLTTQGRELLPPEELELILHQSVRALGRSSPITLTSKLLLSLDDLAAYQASQNLDVRKWADKAFEAVVREACFEKQYLEFLQTKSWEIIEKDIKELMSVKATDIGYCIRQILSAPDLKENEFRELKPHRFEVGLLPLRSTARARVDLTIDATFAITNLDNDILAEKVNQGIDLASDIRQEIHNSLTDVLVEITPNDFYLKFAERREGEKSIEMKLADAVRDKIRSVYNASVANVVVTQVDTDDVRKVRALLHEPHDVEFTVSSRTVTWSSRQRA